MTTKRTARPAPSAPRALADLDVEATGEGYEIDLGEAGVIAFPDPDDLALDDAEALMSAIEDPSAPPSAVFRAWLSPEDYEKFIAARLTLREVKALSQDLGRHYSAFFGSQGNG